MSVDEYRTRRPFPTFHRSPVCLHQLLFLFDSVGVNSVVVVARVFLLSPPENKKTMAHFVRVDCEEETTTTRKKKRLIQSKKRQHLGSFIKFSLFFTEFDDVAA